MIDQGTIDRVMDAAQSGIVDVVSEFVSLKKRGTNYLGNCPFHNEKTPSFIVSPHKGIFKCFGCGKGGNAMHFVMEHEQITYVEAIKYLGKKFHIQVDEVEVSAEAMQLRNDRESMMAVTSFAQRFFERNLFETDEGQSVGLAYFRQRGFRDDIIRKFQLGYSPEERDAFTKEALKNSFKKEFLDKTGLSIFRDDFQSDRFRGRVMFPIHNLSGKPTAFGGRVLKTDAKTAKYLNSPESEIYHKSRILYGIFHAKQEIVKQDRCYLVEGYTDVISMHQAGITNVVASSGTALTQDQIRLIARFTPNITILYDGDNAGIKASLRGIDLVLEEGMNVKVLLLPDGDDPDSFSRKMPADQLREYIAKNETDFIKFKTKFLLDDAKNDPTKRTNLLEEIVVTISKIDNLIVRGEYIKECSELMDVKEEFLYKRISESLIAKNENRKPIAVSIDSTPQNILTPQLIDPALSSFASQNPFENEEREVIRYLIKFGNLQLTKENDNLSVGQFILRELQIDDLESINPLFNRIYKLFETSYNSYLGSSEQFYLNNSDIEVSQFAVDLISRDRQLSKIHNRFANPKKEEDLLFDLVPKVVLELKIKRVQYHIDENTKKIKAAQEVKNEELILQLMLENQDWLKIKMALAKMLGDRAVVR